MLLQYVNPQVIVAYEEAHRNLLQELLREALEQAQLQQAAPPETPQHPTGSYLTVKEAANLTSLAPSTIRLMIRKGKLHAKRVGRRVIIDRQALHSFVNGGSAPTPQPILH